MPGILKIDNEFGACHRLSMYIKIYTATDNPFHNWMNQNEWPQNKPE